MRRMKGLSGVFAAIVEGLFVVGDGDCAEASDSARCWVQPDRPPPRSITKMINLAVLICDTAYVPPRPPDPASRCGNRTEGGDNWRGTCCGAQISGCRTQQSILGVVQRKGVRSAGLGTRRERVPATLDCDTAKEKFYQSRSTPAEVQRSTRYPQAILQATEIQEMRCLGVDLLRRVRGV